MWMCMIMGMYTGFVIGVGVDCCFCLSAGVKVT